MNPNLKLDDSVLANFVRLVQLGLLTRTDITDWMRMVRLQPSSEDSNVLVMTEEYSKNSDAHIEKLLSDVEKIQAEMEAQANNSDQTNAG